MKKFHTKEIDLSPKSPLSTRLILRMAYGTQNSWEKQKNSVKLTISRQIQFQIELTKIRMSNFVFLKNYFILQGFLEEKIQKIHLKFHLKKFLATPMLSDPNLFLWPAKSVSKQLKSLIPNMQHNSFNNELKTHLLGVLN